MNRRHFLTRALASVPVVLAGAELAELLAPRKAIFLPPRGGWQLVISNGDTRDVVVGWTDGRELKIGDLITFPHADGSWGGIQFVITSTGQTT